MEDIKKIDIGRNSMHARGDIYVRSCSGRYCREKGGGDGNRVGSSGALTKLARIVLVLQFSTYLFSLQDSHHQHLSKNILCIDV